MFQSIGAKLGNRIGIIGGSVAGLTVAKQLLNKGYDVTVFERSASQHLSATEGLVLPKHLVQRYIKLGLLDNNIPNLGTTVLRFAMKCNDSEMGTRFLGNQFLNTQNFNWSHFHTKLRSDFSDSQYINNADVYSIYEDFDYCKIETLNGDSYIFDRVIAADGDNSFLRESLYPNALPLFTDQVVWRGVNDDPDIFAELLPFELRAYVMENGYLSLYLIPAADYVKSGKKLLKWELYQYCPELPMTDWFIDKNNEQQWYTIPPGLLHCDRIKHLNQLAHRTLPKKIANIIQQTAQPSLQAIYDYQAPAYVNSRLLLLGDAASVIRPHNLGVVKAMESAISLAQAMDPEEDVNIHDRLTAWSEAQIAWDRKQIAYSQLVSRALITEPPNWVKMDNNAIDQWWSALMQGKLKTLFETESTFDNRLQQDKTFTPMKNQPMNDEEADLSAQLNNIHISSAKIRMGKE